jgi:iron(III) transport system permease protein
MTKQQPTFMHNRPLFWQHFGLFLLALLFLLPFGMLFWQATDFSTSIAHWQHLSETWLMEAIVNSLLLTLLSATGAVLLGTSLAWLVVSYRFPGSKVLAWLLILPLALPPYVVAMLLTWWADSSGTLHLWLRDMGWVEHWIEIRNLPLLAGLFSCLFMPYVFLLARASFQRQGLQAFEAARVLGLSPYQAFVRAAMPTARPAIVAGATLVMMETLADYGASSLFAVPTITQAIYRSWFNLGDWALAAQLSVALMSSVLLLLWLFSPHKSHQQIQRISTDYAKKPKQRRDAWLMSSIGWLVFLLAFVLPVSLLLWQSFAADVPTWTANRLGTWFGNSLLLAGISASFAMTIALLLSWQSYRYPEAFTPRFATQLLSLGYGVPGTALAVAILLTWQQFALAAGVAALLFAYCVRFMSIAIQSSQSGLAQLSPRLLEAAQLHGYHKWQLHTKITLPLLSPHLLAGSLMVAIEVLKELPATLMLRPFNFDTLAVITYQYAQDERIPEAANAALLIVVASMIGLVLVKWLEARSTYNR